MTNRWIGVAVLEINYYICTIMDGIKNIVFDLGGVVFARDPRKFEREFIEFFSYIMLPEMPHFWEEYDRGVSTYNKVIDDLAEYNSCDRELAEHNLRRSIVTQEEIPATKSLIADLKVAKYKLYVLSNMSLDFIEFLKTKEVYKYFDGEVVSCYEKVVKPDTQIYQILVDKYDLNPEETLFIDDRKSNVEAAQSVGIYGFHFDARNPDASCNELRRVLLNK